MVLFVEPAGWILAHLSQRLKVLDVRFSLSTIASRPSPKLLAGFLPTLAGIILIWSSLIIVQMIPICCIKKVK